MEFVNFVIMVIWILKIIHVYLKIVSKIVLDILKMIILHNVLNVNLDINYLKINV